MNGRLKKELEEEVMYRKLCDRAFYGEYDEQLEAIKELEELKPEKSFSLHNL